MEGFVVFKCVDAFADDAAAPIRRDCTFKVDFTVCAVGASERIGNRAIERIRASLAKWRRDALSRFRALFANMNAALGIRATTRAMGRETERASGAPQTTYGLEERHDFFSHSQSSTPTRMTTPTPTRPTVISCPSHGRRSRLSLDRFVRRLKPNFPSTIPA